MLGVRVFPGALRPAGPLTAPTQAERSIDHVLAASEGAGLFVYQRPSSHSTTTIASPAIICQNIRHRFGSGSGVGITRAYRQGRPRETAAPGLQVRVGGVGWPMRWATDAFPSPAAIGGRRRGLSFGRVQVTGRPRPASSVLQLGARHVAHSSICPAATVTHTGADQITFPSACVTLTK